jgi:uridine kinase
MIVIDGLYAIGCQEADLKVFIELTYHETKKAQSSRGKEPQNEYRMRVLEQEHKAVQSLKQYADILIDKAYKVRLA